jgi:hypothetical protein
MRSQGAFIKMFVGSGFVLLSLAFIISAAIRAHQQARLISDALPMRATMIGSDPEWSGGSEGNRRSYVLKYTYQVDGQSYEGTAVRPAEHAGAKPDAGGLAERFSAGAVYDGFYRAGDPSVSFLLKEASANPYVAIAFISLHFALGVGLIVAARTYCFTQLGPGEFRSTATSSFYRCSEAMLIAWLAVGVPSWGHYLFTRTGPVEGLALVAIVLWSAVAVGLLLWFGYQYRMSRKLGAVRLKLDPYPLPIVDGFRFELDRELVGRAGVQAIELAWRGPSVGGSRGPELVFHRTPVAQTSDQETIQIRATIPPTAEIAVDELIRSGGDMLVWTIFAGGGRHELFVPIEVTGWEKWYS